MKISLDWLSDFVAFTEQGPQKIAERLTLGIAEVEHVEAQGALLEHCVVGKVLAVEKHPNADTLKLCDVQTDQGKKRVVCGGTNLHPGMLVAFAHIGARVKWHGGEIQELMKAKIRGEPSEGMICAASELDLAGQFPESTERNIIDLGDSGFDVGKPLREALGLTDVVFHIDNHAITHRADMFSHLGFARECVALGLGAWKKKPSYPSPAFGKDPVPFRCICDVPKLVPRYASCLLGIDGVGETPPWMKRRLEATGWRSLNLPIDITNYVAMELGMPLHSFDAADLRGDLRIREAQQGERIVTLDSVERELPKGAIVLADEEGIFDLLGVMGGLRSGTKESTRKIYLHSAIIDPLAIRRTIIATGHRTDASTVYEKGVPRALALSGLFRALELFLAHVPGARILSRLETFGEEDRATPIILPLARVSSLLGKDIPKSEVQAGLQALEFTVEESGVGMLSVTPPLHRLGDIHGVPDLIEEVARVASFAAFEPEFPAASIAPPPRDHRLSRIRQTLRELGCTEVVRSVFMSESLLRKVCMESGSAREITNPLGEELRYLRPSLLPRLLEAASENLLLSEEHALRLFEVGNIFRGDHESLAVTLLVAGKRDAGLREEPFLLAKAAICEMLATLNFAATVERVRGASDPYVHPARRAELRLGKEGIGAVYEVHPAVCHAFGLPHRAAAATVDLTSLLARSAPDRAYSAPPAFPEVTYDTTIPVAEDTAAALLLRKVHGSHALLRSVRLIDLYRKGEERQLTFRCTYGAPDRTLTEEEVKPVHEKVEAMLRL